MRDKTKVQREVFFHLSKSYTCIRELWFNYSIRLELLKAIKTDLSKTIAEVDQYIGLCEVEGYKE